MKKILALLLCLVMVPMALAACGQTQETPPVETPKNVTKTGLAIISNTEKSKDAGEGNGLAQFDSIVVAVLVDSSGKIVNAAIDSAQTKVEFTNKGKITTPLDSVFEAKQELGEKYGMKKASKIGKEWNEEATALSNYVIGKTIEEVKGIAVNETGVPTDTELSSSVTISIPGYITAIEKAVANAKEMGAGSGDKLGLGVVTTIAKSKDAADTDGLAQAYTYYTASSFGSDGKITSCVIDASQTNINFSKDGKITSDIKAEYKTKNELGEAYGMKKASTIGKEWNEQAEAFAKYVVGKTVSEVKGIAVKEGVPTEAELTSSVTVHVTDLMTIIEKAFNLKK